PRPGPQEAPLAVEPVPERRQQGLRGPHAERAVRREQAGTLLAEIDLRKEKGVAREKQDRPEHGVGQTLSQVRPAGNGCATNGAEGATNRLETPAKRCFEMLFVAARELQAGPIVQDDHVLAAEIGLQLLDPLDIYDRRPVD